MAEFCLDCFNEMNGTHYTKSEVLLEEDLCEGCGQIKPCVMDLKPKPLLLRLISSPKKLLCFLLVSLLLVSVFAFLYKGERECVLCNSFRYHAPVLIDLESGSCVELSLYAPHETQAAELAKEQPKGETFSLINIGAASGYRDLTQRIIEIDVPMENGNKTMLCSACRKQFNQVDNRYILADLYSEKNLIAIQDGSAMVLRCYEISMTQKNDAISVVIQGILEE